MFAESNYKAYSVNLLGNSVEFYLKNKQVPLFLVLLIGGKYRIKIISAHFLVFLKEIKEKQGI